MDENKNQNGAFDDFSIEDILNSINQKADQKVSEHLNDIKTVSYTHLDVYKRQLLTRPTTAFIRLKIEYTPSTAKRHAFSTPFSFRIWAGRDTIISAQEVLMMLI